MPVPYKGSVRAGKHLLCWAVALASCGAAPLVLAQSVPDAGQLLNEHQQTLPSEPRSTEPPPAFELPSDSSRPADSGLRVQLKEIRFSGDTELAQAENLQELVKPVLGKTLDHAGLQQLVDSLTRYLRGRGYVLARAYLPRQDLTEGKLEIALVKGRLQSGTSRIELNGNTRSSNDRLRDIADAALPEGKVLQVEELERALLLINDQPGVSAQSALERGTEPGTSRLLIHAKQDALVDGGVSMDNYGNRSTGTARANAQINVNDPLGIGDQLSIGLSKSTGSDVVGGSYSLPLTASGLRLNASASYLRYEVDQEEFRSLDLRGTARSGSLGLSYPLIRSRLQNLNLSATYEYKALEDRGLGTNLRDRELNNFIVAMSGNRFDSFAGGGVTDAMLALTFGDLDLSGNRDDQFADSVSAKSDGSFHKLNLRVSRLQSLGAASPWTLFGGVSAQWAGDNLDSSEKFLLGGPSGVRAYPVGEASADHGWLATLELRRNIDLGLPSVTLQGLGFLDTGRVWLNENPWPGSLNNADETNRYDLHAVGLGANLWAGDFSVRTAAARTLGDNPGRGQSGLDADGRDSDWRAWIQVAYAF
jgi:hemolysin activation/secretion protein